MASVERRKASERAEIHARRAKTQKRADDADDKRRDKERGRKRRQRAKKRMYDELPSVELSTAPELLDSAPIQAGM